MLKRKKKIELFDNYRQINWNGVWQSRIILFFLRENSEINFRLLNDVIFGKRLIRFFIRSVSTVRKSLRRRPRSREGPARTLFKDVSRRICSATSIKETKQKKNEKLKNTVAGFTIIEFYLAGDIRLYLRIT